MKYAAEMGSGAMMCLPSFIRKSFTYSKVNKGDTQNGDPISLLSFFQTKYSRLTRNSFACVYMSVKFGPYFRENTHSLLLRRGDNIKVDYNELGCSDVILTRVTQDYSQWHAVLNTVIYLPVPYDNFLNR
jgi:hypothetical protein